MKRRAKLLTDMSQDRNDLMVRALPVDLEGTIPQEPLLWLSKFEISREEIIENDLCWSPERQWLVFPYYNSENSLISWQARTFGKQDNPKWLTFGPIHDLMAFYAPDESTDQDTVVLVEDVISAIRVGRTAKCSPVFGSNLSRERLSRYARAYKHLIFWFDRDAVNRAIGCSQQLSSLGGNVKGSVVVTDFDPKAYSDDEIRQYLQPVL